MRATPQAIAAATRLRESKLIVNSCSARGELPGFRADSDDQKKLSARFSLPLNMALVERLIRKPLVASATKGGSAGLSVRATNYALCCEQDLTIWHEHDDAFAALNDFAPQHHGAQGEFSFFVLWALSRLRPGLYQKLVAQDLDACHRAHPHTPQILTAPQTPPASPASPPQSLPSPIAYNALEPPFRFNDGQVLGRDSIHPSALVHTFVSGATGVGKTYGAVKPLLQSFLAYQNAQGQAMGLLVIDPKAELLEVCVDDLARSGQSERLLRLGEGQKLSFFKDGESMGLEERYRTLAQLVSIKSSGDAAVWQEKGHRLNINMLTCDRRFELQSGTLLWGVVRSLIEGVDYTQHSQWANILAIYKLAGVSRADLHRVYAISQVLLMLCPQPHPSVFAEFLSDSEMLLQLYFRISNAEKVCSDLSAPEITQVMTVELYPRFDASTCSVEDLLEQGKVILLQPRSGYFGDICGRLVKARFFSDVLMRRNMLRPVGYVADEFQRFITSDRETGEQSFLDRCRAYRVNCVLATQSLSSLEHALLQSGEVSPSLAVDIIVANSPTKLIYRSLDAGTQHSLRRWIPPASVGRAHVLDVRPVAQLPMGLAYFMCDGQWGMYRYNKVAGSRGQGVEAQPSGKTTRLKGRHHATHQSVDERARDEGWAKRSD